MTLAPNWEEGRFVMRIMISAVVVVTMLALALPAVAQQEGTQAASCDWYWWYQFNRAGGWEYWCWDPQWGWWYGESEDGKQRSITLRG